MFPPPLNQWLRSGLYGALFLMASVRFWLALSGPLPPLIGPSLVNAVSVAGQWHLVHAYGLFSVMTKQRWEIVLEGSNEGVHWKEYLLPYQPPPRHRAPAWIAPMQPRLDWQMWFVPLEPTFPTYLDALLCQILSNQKATLSLFATNPFPTHPPSWMKVVAYRYEMTSLREKKETGLWWKRGEEKILLGPITACRLSALPPSP